MNISKNGQSRKRKTSWNSIVVTASTAVLLGLYFNGNVVKANSLKSGQNDAETAKKANTKTSNSASQNDNQNNQDDVRATKNESVDQTKNTPNELNNGSQENTSELAPAKETDKKNALTKAATHEGTWHGIKATYSSETKELTILGGTVGQPVKLTNPGRKFPLDFSPNYRLSQDDVEKITISGKIKIIGDANRLFSFYRNLKTISGMDQLDTTEVTIMREMFWYCRSLTSLDLNHFSTSQAIEMEGMFGGCSSLTNLDLSHFNTSQVYNIACMFYRCSSLTSIDLSHFNTSQLTWMWGMFSGCSALTNIDLSSFDMSKISHGGCDNMLEKLPNLRKIVLGPKCKFPYYSMAIANPDSKWINVADGTIENAKGNKIGTLADILKNYNGATDHDTYILFGVVKVHYRDENGQELAADQDLKGELGANYNVAGLKELAGYTFKEIRGDATGTYARKPKEVTYVYTKNSDNGSGSGSDMANSSNNDSGSENSSKPGDKPTSPANTAQVTVGATGLAQGGNITIHYRDERGNEVASDEVLSGKVGESYQSTLKEIAGYTLKEVKGEPVGYFTKSEQTITYVYTKAKTGRVVNPTLVTGKKVRMKQLATKRASNNEQKQGANSLPQTGTSKKLTGIWTVLGSLLVLISSVIGGFLKRPEE